MVYQQEESISINLCSRLNSFGNLTTLLHKHFVKELDFYSITLSIEFESSFPHIDEFI